MQAWPTVDLSSSGLVPFGVEHCWPVVREFGEVWRIYQGMKMGGKIQNVRSGMLVCCPLSEGCINVLFDQPLEQPTLTYAWVGRNQPGDRIYSLIFRYCNRTARQVHA